MKFKKQIIDKTLKKNLTVYKTFRRIYDKASFKNQQKNQKIFPKRIEKLKKKHEKTFDLTKKPDLNVILITIDCLRDDHLSHNGYHRDTTPFLDELKSYKSTLVASAPWTYPSISSVLTGFYPHNHHAIMDGKIKKFDINNLKPLRSNVLTLSEILSFYNYSTYLYSTIDMASIKIKDRFESSKLFSFQDGNSVLNEIKKWMIKQDHPFFVNAHITDLHEPIDLKGKYANAFGEVKKLKDIQRWNYQKPEKQIGKRFNEFKRNKILLYDNKLRETDYFLNNFYSFLEKNGLIDNSIIIFTADHGEEFWDHNDLEKNYFYDVRGYAGIGHGHSVFNELINIPLYIFGPNIKNRNDKKLGCNVDIVPTVLNLLDIDNNILFDGKNIFDSNDENRMILSENTIHGYEKKSIITKNFKFIQSSDDNVNWLFNLKNDPKEMYPISDEKMNALFSEKLKHITKKKNNLWRL